MAQGKIYNLVQDVKYILSVPTVALSFLFDLFVEEMKL